MLLMITFVLLPSCTSPALVSEEFKPGWRSGSPKQIDTPITMVEKSIKCPDSEIGMGETAQDHRSHKLPLQVFVRIRPLVGEEVGQALASLVEGTSKATGKKTLQMSFNANGREQDRYFRGFEGVVHPDMDNTATFEKVLKPLVCEVLEGKTSFGFAYGHTGKKTYYCWFSSLHKQNTIITRH
jgi:hypothetical protein